jgi:hypothetical protein
MRTLSLAIGLWLATLPAPPALAQSVQSRCADCHLANLASSPVLQRSGPFRHFQDWDLSPHSRHGVGCDKCHGGNPTTFERFPAHQDLLDARHPASPINRVNVPRTCGTCHTGPYVAFQRSRHYRLVREGDVRGPTCTTCHGEVSALLPSPRALEAQCAECHGEGRIRPRDDYPASARVLMEEVRAVRASLKEARTLIHRIRDEKVRANFEAAYQQAEVPIVEARTAAHEFVFDNLTERLSLARRRTDALMEALANRTR